MHFRCSFSAASEKLGRLVKLSGFFGIPGDSSTPNRRLFNPFRAVSEQFQCIFSAVSVQLRRNLDG